MGCEGAILWHFKQLSLFFLMSFVIPGQNIHFLALEIIDDVPWCAACKVLRASDLNATGITTLSLYVTRPSLLDKLSWYLW